MDAAGIHTIYGSKVGQRQNKCRQWVCTETVYSTYSWMDGGRRKQSCLSMKAAAAYPIWGHPRSLCTGRSGIPILLTIFIKVWNWAVELDCNHIVVTLCFLTHSFSHFLFLPIIPRSHSRSSPLDGGAQPNCSEYISMPTGIYLTEARFYLLRQSSERWETFKVDWLSNSQYRCPHCAFTYAALVLCSGTYSPILLLSTSRTAETPGRLLKKNARVFEGYSF